MKQPNSFVEVFLSLIKWFLVVLLINNLIWAMVFVISNSSVQETTTLSQDGTDNIQGINNGTIN